MLRWSYVIFLLLIASVHSAQRVNSKLFRYKRQGFTFDESDSDSSSCTFEGQTGACIELKDCRLATTILRNPSTANLQRLQKMTCRFEGKIPFVCCPSEGVEDQPPTFPKIFEIPSPPPPQPQPTIDTKAPKKNVRDVCGFSNGTIPRIVGGIDAVLDAWPWMAAIFMEQGGVKSFSLVSCGGALISDEFVLTAAHCALLSDGTTKHLPSTYTIRFGDLDILSTKDNATTTDVGVSEVIPHPGYNRRTIHNDIALLRLDKPIVTFTKSVRPICLPSPSLINKHFVDFSPHVAGWGRLVHGGNSSNILRQVQVKIVSNEQCKQSYSSFKQTTIISNQLCAGFDRGGKDACQGDSGGPLMLVVDGRWTVIGLSSFGFRCAEPGFPGVYTRTVSYLDWVLANARMQ